MNTAPQLPADIAEAIRLEAHRLHASVNQYYDSTLPYGVHLDMVAQGAMQYLPEIEGVSEEDALAVWFGAMFHDSIEDARLTYNDVMRRALQYMTEPQALMATEIVYALTNEKGRTRAERADSRYYDGIRRTPYAPLVKAADRLANMTYSITHSSGSNPSMATIYSGELPHFLRSIIDPDAADPRMRVPQAMSERLLSLAATDSD